MVTDIYLAEGARTNRGSWDPNGPNTQSTDHSDTIGQSAIGSSRRTYHSIQMTDNVQTPDPEHPDPIAKQHMPAHEQPGSQEVKHADAELAAAQKKYGAPQAMANHLSEHQWAGESEGVAGI